MELTVSGKATSSKEVQFQNAQYAISVTFGETVTFVRLLQFINALSASSATVSGITNSPLFVSSQEINLVLYAL